MPEGAGMSHSTQELVTEISSTADWNDVKKHSMEEKKGILLQFTAQWCPPCRVIAPVVSKLAEAYCADVTFVKADIDNVEIGEVVAEHSVSAVPMFVGYTKGGVRAVTFTGADKNALQQAVEQLASAS
jgi:thioredoxin 1